MDDHQNVFIKSIDIPSNPLAWHLWLIQRQRLQWTFLRFGIIDHHDHDDKMIMVMIIWWYTTIIQYDDMGQLRMALNMCWNVDDDMTTFWCKKKVEYVFMISFDDFQVFSVLLHVNQSRPIFNLLMMIMILKHNFFQVFPLFLHVDQPCPIFNLRRSPNICRFHSWREAGMDQVSKNCQNHY